jgi:hypothetical protein
LEIAQFDFPSLLDWSDAKKLCANLGDGWRLPTKDELIVMYQNKNKIEGFADDHYYWSLSKDDGNYEMKDLADESAYSVNMYSGSPLIKGKCYVLYVRAIRSL